MDTPTNEGERAALAIATVLQAIEKKMRLDVLVEAVRVWKRSEDWLQDWMERRDAWRAGGMARSGAGGKATAGGRAEAGAEAANRDRPDEGIGGQSLPNPSRHAASDASIRSADRKPWD